MIYGTAPAQEPVANLGPNIRWVHYLSLGPHVPSHQSKEFLPSQPFWHFSNEDGSSGIQLQRRRMMEI